MSKAANTTIIEGGNFSVMPNDLLNDSEISLAAKGLYIFMRGKPEGWNFTIRSMTKQLKEGQAAITTALKELKNTGWVKYSKNADGTGVYHIYWSAKPVATPQPENPSLGNPNLGKSTRISKTDQLVRKIDSNSCARPSDEHESSGQKIQNKTKRKDCPALAIVDLYHQILPEMTEVKVLTDARRRALQARWRENTSRQSLNFWVRFFEYVRTSPFLMGNVERKGGMPPWKADFEWLVKAGNFVKIIEGKYHND